MSKKDIDMSGVDLSMTKKAKERAAEIREKYGNKPFTGYPSWEQVERAEKAIADGADEMRVYGNLFAAYGLKYRPELRPTKLPENFADTARKGLEMFNKLHEKA